MAKKERGRPNAYTERILPRMDEIVSWARAGATNAEIASALGVAKSTLQDYLSKEADFSDSLKVARMSGVPEVKKALYKRAVGFEYIETKKGTRPDKDGNMITYEETITKYAIPDVGAIQTFLRNNCDDFRDRDKTVYDLKEKEIKLRQEIADKTNF